MQTIQAVAAEMVKAIAKQTGYTVDVMFIGDCAHIGCTRDAASAVKTVMAQVSNATLQTEHDWQNDPDFQDFPIELIYAV